MPLLAFFAARRAYYVSCRNILHALTLTGVFECSPFLKDFKMPVVSITRLHLSSWRYLLPFIFLVVRSSRQAKAAVGNLAVSKLRDSNNAFWTRTVWTTEATMKSFMLSGPHRKAMPRLLEWCDEAAMVHWIQDSENETDWHEAHALLRREGRRSKVRYPSPAHENYYIAEP